MATRAQVGMDTKAYQNIDNSNNAIAIATAPSKEAIAAFFTKSEMQKVQKKAGVIGFMKGLSKELASFGITANCITPSLVETDLLKEMSDDHIAGIRARTLMGRLCTVNEVAGMVVRVACSYSTDTALTFQAVGHSFSRRGIYLPHRART